MAWTNADSWRRTGKGDPESWISLPQHFKHHGYLTLGGGKTFHPGEPLLWDLPKSWSQKFVTFNTAQPLGYFNFELVHCPGDHDSLDTWCPLDGSLNQHYDYRLANWTINALRYASRSPDNGVPWFIAAGFRRPHTPFKMPRQYWELYNESEIALASNSAWPTDAPAIAYHQAGFELGPVDGAAPSYLKVKPDINKPFAPNVSRAIRRAYYSCVSWQDSQIGRVLAELQYLQQENNTIVAIVGDHGVKLPILNCAVSRGV